MNSLVRFLTMYLLLQIMINFLKNWAVGSFESTRDFYEGKWGFAIEILILIMVFLCYALLRKVKENDDRIKVSFKKDITWQERIYRTPIIETFLLSTFYIP